MKKFLLLIISFCLFTSGVNAAEDLAPNSKSAILIEQSTGKVLFEKNANEKLAPASMTKVMSMLLIMEAIDDGKINLTDNAINYIIENSYDVNYGARPIKRYIQRNIETLIANNIIKDTITPNSNITIDVINNEFIIK